MSFAKNCSNAQKDSQNAPKDVNAVAPNVLPVRNSHMPARSCARPPYARASPSTIGMPPSPISPELKKLRTNVVSANAASPRGPGSAVIGLVAITSPSDRAKRRRAISPCVTSSAAVPPLSVGSRAILPSISPTPCVGGNDRHPCCNQTGRGLTSDLEQHRVALPAAGADRRHAEAATAPPQLVHEGADDTRAGRADRVAERDRASVHVHLALVDAEHAHPVE